MPAVGDRAYGYRPVILMHGLLVSSEAMDSLEERILTAHPGTPVFNIDAYNDAVRANLTMLVTAFTKSGLLSTILYHRPTSLC